MFEFKVKANRYTLFIYLFFIRTLLIFIDSLLLQWQLKMYFALQLCMDTKN